MKPVFADAYKNLIRKLFIQELTSFGVTNASNGNCISGLDYYSLRCLLAAERIKRGDE